MLAFIGVKRRILLFSGEYWYTSVSAGEYWYVGIGECWYLLENGIL